MIKLTSWDNTLSQRQLSQIVEILKDGGVIIWPTDTLYALACDALNSKAVGNLCSLKHINPDKTNLSIVCDSISMASRYAKIDNNAFAILKANTPGPFTFLFKTTQALPKEFKRRRTIGIRIPEVELCRSIVNALDRPLLTTSVPAEDEDYATSPDLMEESLNGKASLIIDAGRGDVEPSTIVDLTEGEPMIIRQGKSLLI